MNKRMFLVEVDVECGGLNVIQSVIIRQSNSLCCGSCCRGQEMISMHGDNAFAFECQHWIDNYRILHIVPGRESRLNLASLER